MASGDARPVPLKNTAYRVYFPILDADGDLVTGATGLDSEISKDGGTFTDCTSEATEVATSSGMYYLELTSTEMNADAVVIIVKTSTSGAKTTPIVLYPAEAEDIPANVTAWSGTAIPGVDSAGYPKVTIKDGTGTGEIDTSGGKVLLADNALTAAVVASDAVTELQSGLATATALATATGYIDTEIAAILADTNELQTDWVNGGRLDLLIDGIKAKSDTLPASPAAVGSAMTLATGAITAAVIATGAIDADAISSDAVTEIQSGLATATALQTIDDNVDAILVDTSTTLDGLIQDIPTNAEFNARTLAAANYFDPATDTVKLAAATHTGAVIPTVTTVTNDVGISQTGADKVWSSASRTLSAFGFSVTVGTNSDKTGYSLSPAGVQAIWDAATSALTTVGSIGKLLIDRIDAAITSRMATFSYTAPLDAAGTRSAVGLASANLDTQLGDIPTNAEFNARTLPTGDYFNPATDDVTLAAGELSGLSTLTAAQVWSYVTRELTSGGGGGGLTAGDVWSYATRELTGKTGFELVAAYDAAKSAASASALQTVDDMVDDLETRITSARAGYLDKLNVSGTLAHSDAAGTYKADVSGLATAASVAALNNLSQAQAQTAAAAALTAYDPPTKGELDTAVSGMSTLTAAQVWSYVTRELTSGGGGGGGATAQEVWEYATRELTGKSGFELTTAYDAAKSAAPVGAAMTLAANSVTAAALASDATAEIQSGLATSAEVADLPTNSELATALAAADDAVLAAIGMLHDLDSAGAQAAAAAALAAYGTAKTSDVNGLSTFNPAADAVTVGMIQVDAITAGSIATAAAQKIADTILSRSYANVEGTAGDHTLAALIAAALESAIVGTAWTIYKTDGITPLLSKTVAVDSDAEPITAVS